MTSFSHLFPLPPKSYQSDACMGPGGGHTCKRFQSQLKNPEMRKLLSCLRKYKPTYLIFSTQADIVFIFLDSKQSCPLSWRKIIPLFSKAGCSMNILEKVVKSWQYLCSHNIQKHRRPMESCLPIIQLSSVQFSCSVMSDSLRPHGLQHTRPPCPSPTPGACLNSGPLSQWCYPTISSSVVPFSSHLQSFPESGSFPMSHLFASGGQSIGVSTSASILPMNIQDWFPLGWTGWISLLSKGLSRVFSNTTVQKHQFLDDQLSL